MDPSVEDSVVEDSLEDSDATVLLLSLLVEDVIIISLEVVSDEEMVELISVVDEAVSSLTSSMLLSDDEVGCVDDSEDSCSVDVLLELSFIIDEVVESSAIELVDDELSAIGSLEVLGAKVIDALGERLVVEGSSKGEEDWISDEERVAVMLSERELEILVLSPPRGSLTASCTNCWS